MKEAATITMMDIKSSEEAYAIVRYSPDSVALCLSLKSNGDVEVLLSKSDAKALVEALLNKAIA